MDRLREDFDSRFDDQLGMVDAMVEESATTTRLGRMITPSTRAQEALGSDNLSTVRTSKKSITLVALTAVKKAASLRYQ
jgi:hypothetical protein